MREDFKLGWRLLAKSPLFALSVWILLGLGIGANTVLFTLTDHLLLRPLNVERPEGLVRFVERHATGFQSFQMMGEAVEPLRQLTGLFEEVWSEETLDLPLKDAQGVERVRVHSVSTNFFGALGLKAKVGEVLRPDEAQQGAFRAVLSDAFWRKKFHGEAGIVGQRLQLGGVLFTVAGVLEPGVNGMTVETGPDLRIHEAGARAIRAARGKKADEWESPQPAVYARLRSGVRREQAEAQAGPRWAEANWKAMAREVPNLRPEKMNESRLVLEDASHGVSGLRDQLGGGLQLLMGGVALLLLMATANVAGLLLARTAGRVGELRMRLALGASRWLLVRQLLVEGFCLTGPGGLLGVGLSYLALPLILGSIPPLRDRAAVAQSLTLRIEPDFRVLLFGLLVTVLATLLIGSSPALWVGRLRLMDATGGGRNSTARGWARPILLAFQTAVSVVLLAGGGALLETMLRLQRVDPGFAAEGLIAFTVDPGLNGYSEEEGRRLSLRLLEEVRQSPGVMAASASGRGLMRGTGVKATLAAQGQLLGKMDFLNSSLNAVTPGFIDTLGMRLLAGRDLAPGDEKQQPAPVLVNQAFVRRFLANREPIGQLIGPPGPDGRAVGSSRVVGVVSDAKYRSLREETPPTVYGAQGAGLLGNFVLYVRGRGGIATVVRTVQDAMKRVDPALPFVEVETLSEEVQRSFWKERLLATLAMGMAGMGLLITLAGLIAAMNLTVRARTREIGVRLAVGARQGQIASLLLAQAFGIVVAGASVGAIAYASIAPRIAPLAYGLRPESSIYWLIAVGILLLLALMSLCAPLRRAVTIEPASALRVE